MATETTTLRLPVALRDEIARIATERGSSMLDVVTDAVRRLSREQWWEGVQGALDQMTDQERAGYHAEAGALDAAAADGLRAG